MSKPLPTLSNMPWNIKQDIINRMDWLTRISLRNCSTEFRDIIDTSLVTYPMHCIELGESYLVVSMMSNKQEFRIVHYFDVSEDSCKLVYNKNGVYWVKVVTGQHFIQRAVSDFASLVKSPKSCVEYFHLKQLSDESLWRDRAILLTCLKSTLEKLTHQISVIFLNCDFPATQEDVLHVLPLLKPGTLQIIDIVNRRREVERLVGTDQWKMLRTLLLKNESSVRIQDLLHLDLFVIKNHQLVPEEMPLLIQAFLSRHENHPHYRIGLPNDYNLGPIVEWLDTNETLDARAYLNSWHMRILGSEFSLYICIRNGELKLFLIKLLL